MSVPGEGSDGAALSDSEGTDPPGVGVEEPEPPEELPPPEEPLLREEPPFPDEPLLRLPEDPEERRSPLRSSEPRRGCEDSWLFPDEGVAHVVRRAGASVAG